MLFGRNFSSFLSDCRDRRKVTRQFLFAEQTLDKMKRTKARLETGAAPGYGKQIKRFERKNKDPEKEINGFERNKNNKEMKKEINGFERNKNNKEMKKEIKKN